MILESSCIDHTNLKPTATEDDIRKLCDEAKDYGFRGVCVHPYYVNLAHFKLVGMGVKVVVVVGFPLGANISKTKVFETKLAIDDGADEIDVVWNLGTFKAKKYLEALSQLKRVVNAAQDRMVKVIVETCYLDPEEIEKAYQIVRDSGAGCIKTSTGFGTDGASLLAVLKWKELRKQNQDNLKIKAAGGIRNFEVAQGFLNHGADIIGTSHGIKIMKEKNRNG